jgi:amidohydrolase
MFTGERRLSMSDGIQKTASHLKDRARHLAGELAGEVMGLAQALFRSPELSGEEEASARLLAGALEQAGFEVETGAGGLPTAFVAQTRTAEGPVLAFLAEYDALPEIGHGCGHNLIGAAAVGAAMVLARVAGDLKGQVRVVGTPAEETIGGKVVLVRNGIFSDVDAALMVHPGYEDRVLVDSLACESLEVAYAGKSAHAVAHPEKGINALDALIALFNARDALLRQCPPGMRLVGVIAEGGIRPNMIPERAVGQFSIRAGTRRLVRGAAEAFRRRATALAEAYGCEVRIRELDLPYEEMVTNVALAEAYGENLQALGVSVMDGPRENMGSLDMGCVSYEVPSLHPFFGIVPPTVASHTREFAKATQSAAGRTGLLRSVQALAMTGIDFLTDPDLRRRTAAEHRRFRQTLETTGGEV